MLVNIDVLVSEDIIRNLFRKITVIDSCANIEVFFMIIIKLMNQVSQTEQYIIISLQNNFTVIVRKLNLLYDHNYLFESDCH